MENKITSKKKKNHFATGIAISLPIVITLGLIFDKMFIAMVVVIPYGLVLGLLIKRYDKSNNKKKQKRYYLILFFIGITILIAESIYYISLKG